MEVTRTGRGFAKADFIDKYGEKCSIQKSSIATEDCIWLGINDPEVKALAKELHPERAEVLCGWLNVPLPECAVVNGRMHLTQENVMNLMPILQRFIETGEIE